MKKKKIIIGIITTICNIPISLILSIIVHTQLLQIDIPKTLNGFLEIVNDKFLLLLFMIFMLFEVLIIAMLTISKNTFHSELDSITNNIKTPKSVGQGQHGTARWQTQKEFQKNFKCNEFPKKDKENYEANKGGLVVGYSKDKKKEKIYFVDDNIHSLTVGATRSGKTRSVVLQTIGNLALAGESMILSDPKRRAF